MREMPAARERVRRVSAVLNQARILNQRWENFRGEPQSVQSRGLVWRGGVARCSPFRALVHCACAR